MKKWLWVAITPVLCYATMAFIGMQPNPAQWTEFGRFVFVILTAFGLLNVLAWDALK